MQWIDLNIFSNTGWWFQTCFIFHSIWDNPSHWLIFFKIAKTTNQNKTSEFPSPPCFDFQEVPLFPAPQPKNRHSARPWSVNCCAESAQTAAPLFDSGSVNMGYPKIHCLIMFNSYLNGFWFWGDIPPIFRHHFTLGTLKWFWSIQRPPFGYIVTAWHLSLIGCGSGSGTKKMDGLPRCGSVVFFSYLFARLGKISGPRSLDHFSHMGVSENSVPLNPMVNDHYPY